jgi:hypothetical protein
MKGEFLKRRRKESYRRESERRVEKVKGEF